MQRSKRLFANHVRSQVLKHLEVCAVHRAILYTVANRICDVYVLMQTNKWEHVRYIVENMLIVKSTTPNTSATWWQVEVHTSCVDYPVAIHRIAVQITHVSMGHVGLNERQNPKSFDSSSLLQHTQLKEHENSNWMWQVYSKCDTPIHSQINTQ